MFIHLPSALQGSQWQDGVSFLNIDVELSHVIEIPNLLFLQSEEKTLEVREILEAILKVIAMQKYSQKLGN